MKPSYLFFLALAGSLWAAGHKAVAAKSPVVPVRTDSVLTPTASLDAFRLITDRNIFDANRTGRRVREQPAPRVDTINLVGTMDSDEGLRAFFDGSDSAYRKALRVGEAVGDFTVTKIEPSSVELQRAGKPLAMSVGQQLRRPEGADWTLVGADLVRNEAAAAADAAHATPNTPAAIPANASDIVRRMMEQQQKQLKQ